jgi:phospholipase C
MTGGGVTARWGKTGAVMPPDQDRETRSARPIEHVVVLMLENRSFDNLLGTLYPPSANFDGLDLTATNPDPNGVPIPVWNLPGTDTDTMRIPDPDPGELWTDINTQLFGSPTAPIPGAVPAMNGFVKNYLTQKDSPTGKNIMHYFTHDQVPVLSGLAQQFAVCDRWFASAPCQTWPNRWFVHTATADGHENNEPVHLLDVDTIFNRMEQASIDWKIYFHDFAQTKTLIRLWPLGDNFNFYGQFQADCKGGTLPSYSFIEPQYYPGFGTVENDLHPPSVVTLGEQLIADVYNCVRASPLWSKTMLVITFDEHGGCYDHVPPPAATPPEATKSGQVFSFDRFGVRVPTVIVSPYIQAGKILRAVGDVPFDHTSIIATLRKRFPDIGSPLTARDAVAPDLESALELSTPDNAGPPSVEALQYVPTPAEAAVAQSKPLNGMQKSMVELAANLPQEAGVDLQAHIQGLVSGGLRRPPAGTTDSVQAAVAYIRRQAGNFFQSIPSAA